MNVPAEPEMRFVVLGELARGGMGRVQLARRVGAETSLLAVKRIHRHLAADDDAARMFLDEARLLDALDHPNIVRMVGFGSDDEGLFLATEFVDGISLSELGRRMRAAQRAMPAELVAYVGARVAAGLSAAHGLRDDHGEPLDVVHRDISPDNILLGFDGDVKVSDFGIAKALFRMARTTTGVLKGKLHYMSPEYARGDAIDATSDLFSLGVVLYQLVTGSLPFDGDTERQVLREILDGTPAPIGSRIPSADPALAAIFERLLAKSPRERAPGGAAGLAAELDAWLSAKSCSLANARRVLAAHVEAHGDERRRKIAALLDGADESDGAGAVIADDLVDPTRRTRPRTFQPLRRASSPPRHAFEAPASRAIDDAPPVAGTRKVVRPPNDIVKNAPDVTPPRHRTRRNGMLAALVTASAMAAIAFAFRPHRVAARVDTPVAFAEASPDAPHASPPSAPSAPVPPPTIAEAAAVAPTEPISSAGARAPTLSNTAVAAHAAPARPVAPRRVARPAAGPRSGTTATVNGKPTPCTPDNWDYPRCLRP